jgi:hypothetical protein
MNQSLGFAFPPGMQGAFNSAQVMPPMPYGASPYSAYPSVIPGAPYYARPPIVPQGIMPQYPMRPTYMHPPINQQS